MFEFLIHCFLFHTFLGQVFSQKLLSLREQHKTAEGSPSDDDSYLGYSVATGEFNGDNDNADVVVGMPRGANLTGKVVLYTSTLENIFNMTGDQIGAYYGYSVASAGNNKTENMFSVQDHECRAKFPPFYPNSNFLFCLEGLK